MYSELLIFLLSGSEEVEGRRWLRVACLGPDVRPQTLWRPPPCLTFPPGFIKTEVYFWCRWCARSGRAGWYPVLYSLQQIWKIYINLAKVTGWVITQYRLPVSDEMPDWAFYYIRFPKRDSLEKVTELITIIYFVHLNHVLEILQEVTVQAGYI